MNYVHTNYVNVVYYSKNLVYILLIPVNRYKIYLSQKLSRTAASYFQQFSIKLDKHQLTSRCTWIHNFIRLSRFSSSTELEEKILFHTDRNNFKNKQNEFRAM